MKSFYTTDLDGSGQIIAVADSGLDHDHGDFGSRIIGNVDVIGGRFLQPMPIQGTELTLHAPFLGMVVEGNYAGVAPEAETIFPSDGE
ncbi:MAG: hypothetical protein ACJZ5D_02770 [Candidatus Thalassarchaeaceae archaeon]